MKTTILTLGILAILLPSCRKDYVCECTDLNTNSKVIAKHFYSIRPYSKKAAQNDCDDLGKLTTVYSDCQFK